MLVQIFAKIYRYDTLVTQIAKTCCNLATACHNNRPRPDKSISWFDGHAAWNRWPASLLTRHGSNKRLGRRRRLFWAPHGRLTAPCRANHGAVVGR